MKILLTASIIITTLYADLPLVQTGQKYCYDDAGAKISCANSGQDGAYRIGTRPNYSKNSNGTITDNNTGLIWQNVYNESPGGTPQSKDYASTESYCSSLKIDNITQWRVPTLRELTSLIDYSSSVGAAAINATFADTTEAYYYWSSTEAASDTSRQWTVCYAGGGYSSVLSKSETIVYVRCVYGTPDTESNYTKDNGIVTDHRTKLMWQDDYDNNVSTVIDSVKRAEYWHEAITYCESLDALGYSDWRLPNINELRSITDTTRYNGAIDENVFQDSQPSGRSCIYYSSTSRARNKSVARTIQFYDASDGSGAIKSASENLCVRCVRGLYRPTTFIPAIYYLLN